MHKQLLTTAFAAFLALALIFGMISPVAEDAFGAITGETDAESELPAISEEETESPETKKEEEGQESGNETTTVPETEAETEKSEEKEPEESAESEGIAMPKLPAGAQPLLLYINGREIERGFCFRYKMQVYLPVEGFAELVGAEDLRAEAGRCYIVSGERYIPCSKQDISVTVIDCGVPCAPIEALMSAVGLNSTAIVGDSICVWGVPTFPSAKDVYAGEDLYWLSRIISAESRGEPFLGQLAVGTVVINRTVSDYYPDSIYEVVFDKCGGVQFSPTANGSVYNDPTESSVIAAKMCLEGFRLDDNILFFFNSSIALGSWITSNRTYTMTVGQHDFYS